MWRPNPGRRSGSVLLKTQSTGFSYAGRDNRVLHSTNVPIVCQLGRPGRRAVGIYLLVLYRIMTDVPVHTASQNFNIFEIKVSHPGVNFNQHVLNKLNLTTRVLGEVRCDWYVGNVQAVPSLRSLRVRSSGVALLRPAWRIRRQR